MKFATVSDLKNALRMLPEEVHDDALFELLLDASTRSIARYLKSAADPLLAEGAEIPQDVKVATIMLAAILYRSPDSDRDQQFERGHLPNQVEALLHSLRTPTLA